jgi:hypothetical protein
MLASRARPALGRMLWPVAGVWFGRPKPNGAVGRRRGSARDAKSQRLSPPGDKPNSLAINYIATQWARSVASRRHMSRSAPTRFFPYLFDWQGKAVCGTAIAIFNLSRVERRKAFPLIARQVSQCAVAFASPCVHQRRST